MLIFVLPNSRSILPQNSGTGTIPTRAGHVNPVWSWDFISDRTDNGGKLRLLPIIDEHNTGCQRGYVARCAILKGEL